MKLTEMSVKRPITIFMGIIAVILFGIVSFSRLNLDMLPEMELPMLIINTQNYGVSPEDIEEEISMPLEGVIGTVSNVEEINSISKEGASTLLVKFSDGTDMNFASLEVREKVDLIKKMLPETSTQPMIMQMNPAMMPVINFGVTFEGYDEGKINKWADEVLRPSMERVEGVASVDIMGGRGDEIQIVLDSEELNNYGINMQTVVASLKGQNMNLPIGSIEEGDYNVLVRTTNDINSLEDVKKIPLKTNDGKVINLDDVSDVSFGREEVKNLAKINGTDALTVMIQKESTANTVDVSREVKSAVEELKNQNNDLTVIPIMDQGEIIEFMVQSVGKNAIVGGLLAIIVLMLFLKDIRTTIIMGVSIPISIVATFVMVYFGGLTLNMISLGGIALGVGMLVDNSIVVIESVYRYKKMGYSNKESAILGTKEISSAITASTLTSICVFLPIVFVQGMAADIFKEMALTVTFSLVSSLAVSFTLVPVLASKLLSEKSVGKENKTVEKIKEAYGRLLKWSLGNKKYVGLITLIFILFGVVSFTAIGMEFFPEADQGIVSINASMPNGSSLEAATKIGDELVNNLKDIEGVNSTALSVDSSSVNLMLILDKKEDRKETDKEISKIAREKTTNIPGAEINVKTAGVSMSAGSPLQIKVLGNDFDELDSISKDVIGILENTAGVTSIKSNNEKKSDEIRIVIDDKKAAEYGLTTLSIAQGMQGYFKDTKVTTTKIDDKFFDLVIKPKTNISPKVSDLENITISNLRGVKVPLSSVAKLTRGEGFSEIYRSGGSREITVSGDIEGRSLGDVSKDIQKEIENYNIKDGYKITFGGEMEEMKEAFSQMLLALVLAVFLVYMVMAAQFESLINPFIIMFTVPLAFVGALIALFITGVSISIPAMIGFVMLTGIIVNNGIVLIDYINNRRSNGIEVNEAIILAGKTRLQPILMTAITTIMGLLPMALGIGEGSEIQLPLAMTVIGGLTIGTILTLIVIPVVYKGFYSLNLKLKRKK